MSRHVQTVICGAGIAGVAAAYYLAVHYGVRDIVLIDKYPPLSLTTSKSGENYRDYWPQPCMTEFSSGSLDLMQALIDEHGDVFHRREFGYQFVSRERGRDIFPSSEAGATDSPGGVTRSIESTDIHQRWPHLSDDIAQVVGISRAGAVDVYALGSLMLSEARKHGVEFLQQEVVSLAQRNNEFSVSCADYDIAGERLILASGPFVKQMAAQLGIELSLENIPQRKFVIPDPLGVIPSDMPFTICADELSLNWSAEERVLIGDGPAYGWLLDTFPAGLHVKPEGRGQIKLGWAFNRSAEQPRWDIPLDHGFPSLVVRGASQFIPGLSAYIEQLPTPVVQFAGYYTRTAENWPLIGPLDENLYAVAGLSGYGTMTGCAAGDLCARYVNGCELPGYARNFHPARYGDPGVVNEIASLKSDGQL